MVGRFGQGKNYFRSSEKSRSIPLFIIHRGRFDCCLCIERCRIFFSKSYTPNPTPKKIYSPMTNPINTLIFRFHSVSSNQIREIVMAFPSDKVPGYYKLPMSITKDTLPCNFPIVVDNVYRRLLTSVFPTDRKISEIIPLPKEGDHDVANNMQQQLPCVPAHCSVQNM